MLATSGVGDGDCARGCRGGGALEDCAGMDTALLDENFLGLEEVEPALELA